jgi:hypothetical protein
MVSSIFEISEAALGLSGASPPLEPFDPRREKYPMSEGRPWDLL